MPNRAKKSVNARAILDLLASRHAGDVFVPECKDGPTQGSTHLRLDAWAMKRSWANPCCVGYEIKVSRADFLQDDKWPGYLPCCNQLYFACPKGVIKPDELPESVGLLEVASTGTRFFTRRKAPYREGEPPVSLLLYALMRANGFDAYSRKADNAGYWREWIRQREENRELGHKVSKSLRKIVSERIEQTQWENRQLKRENDRLADLQKFLEANGLSAEQYDLKDRVRALLSGEAPKSLLWSIEQMVKAAKRVQDEFSESTATAESPY